MPTTIDERERAHHQRPAELGVLRVLGVEVHRMGVHGEQREPGVVGLGDGAAGAVLVDRRRPRNPHSSARASCPPPVIVRTIVQSFGWTTPLPLAGLRILAVEQYGAGPSGTLLPRRPRRRGDQGREPARGRRRRRATSARTSSARATASSSRPSTATSARIALDLRSAGGRAVLRDLVRSADGVLDNLRGDQPATLGLTYDALQRREPAHRLRAPVRATGATARARRGRASTT